MRERKRKSKGEQTLAEFNKAHRPSQAKCRLVTNQLYIKRIKLDIDNLNAWCLVDRGREIQRLLRRVRCCVSKDGQGTNVVFGTLVSYSQLTHRLSEIVYVYVYLTNKEA